MKTLTSTNAHISIIGKNDKEYLVLKHYPINNDVLAKKVWGESLKIRKILTNNGINVPKIFKISITNNITVLEEYLGESILQLYRKSRLNKNVLRSAEKFLYKIPNEIPVDTNPGNIVIKNDGALFLVDFMPGDPWSFLNSEKFRDAYEKRFPSAISAIGNKRRIKRYHDSYFRVKKLYYYLGLTVGGLCR